MVSCRGILGLLPLPFLHGSACTLFPLVIQADIGPVREDVAQNEQAYKEADAVARAAVGLPTSLPVSLLISFLARRSHDFVVNGADTLFFCFAHTSPAEKSRSKHAEPIDCCQEAR